MSKYVTFGISDAECDLSEVLLAQVLGEELPVELTNLLASWAHFGKKDCPGKLWFDAEPYHPAIGRALRIDRSQEGSVYALAPFRIIRLDGKALIAAAWPCPRILGPVDMDWFGIEVVIAWDPVADTVQALGDTEPQLVGRWIETDKGTLFGSARSFFTAWAMERARFQVMRGVNKGAWKAEFAEIDYAPGCLMVGPADKIAWRLHDLPSHLEVIDADPTQVNRAIMRSVHLPRVTPGQQSLGQQSLAQHMKAAA